MTSIEAINHEIKVLDAELAQQEGEREKLLQKSAHTELSKKEFGLVAGFEALKEIAGRRRAKLEADKKRLENEKAFEELEALRENQYEYYREIMAIDKELAEIEQRRAQLIESRSEKEAHNHAPKMRCAELTGKLLSVDNARVHEILNRYRLSPYL